MTRYQEVIGNLRVAYDGRADQRDQVVKTPWKLAERSEFLARLTAGGLLRLLEIGAGTGQDSAFFMAQGLTVVATDLSPEQVARCRAKGIDAHVMDFLGLDFSPGSFDAVWALNCLLHVPNQDLPAVLRKVRDALRPGGLFFIGVYGGDGTEGIPDFDQHEPPRFFSWRTNEQLLDFARESFEIEDFHVVPLGDDEWFQALTLRRP